MEKTVRVYRFFYHYYRQKGKKMSVHFRGRCMIANNIACFTPAYTKWNKRQPYLVMQGWADKVVLTRNGTAIITNKNDYD